MKSSKILKSLYNYIRRDNKWHFRAIPALALVFLYAGCGPGNKQEETKVSAEKCSDPSGCIVIISNSGSSSSQFTVSGGSFFASEASLTEAIRNRQREKPGEAVEKIAWEYVMQHINYCNPYSEERWQHDPELLFNSSGNGFCDDLAAVLAFLWKDLGFESRVWSLGGHVVPEVFADGKWQMYDPSFQVYYLNSKSEIAGVSELSQDTTLLNNKVYWPEAGIHSKASWSSGRLAGYYSSTDDNYVNDWYAYKNDSLDTRFYLPGKSELSLPRVIQGYFKPYAGGIFPEYSFAEAKIADEIECTLGIPLILYAIKGSGRVMINNENFEIGSKELEVYIRSSKEFIDSIVFPGGHSNVIAHYLVNQRILNDVEQVTLKGSNLENISISLFPGNKENSSAPANIDSIAEHNYKLYLQCKKNTDALLKDQPATATEKKLKAVIAELINCDQSVSRVEKDLRISKIYSNLDVLKTIHGLDFYDSFYTRNLSPERISVLMAYLEYVDQETISGLVSENDSVGK